jgi:hypothetical protein
VRIALALVALALTSCAGGADGAAATTGVDGAGAIDASPDGAPVSTCQITLGGSLAGMIPCTVTAGKRDADDFSIVGVITSGAAPPIGQVLISIQIEGELAARDYTAAQTRATAIMAVATDGKTYAATGGDSPQGTIGTLHLASLTLMSSDDPTTKIWALEGTFTATLVGTSAGGSVTMNVTF